MRRKSDEEQICEGRLTKFCQSLHRLSGILKSWLYMWRYYIVKKLRQMCVCVCAVCVCDGWLCSCRAGGVMRVSEPTQNGVTGRGSCCGGVENLSLLVSPPSGSSASVHLLAPQTKERHLITTEQELHSQIWRCFTTDTVPSSTYSTYT